MSLAAIDAQARRAGLTVLGGLHPGPEETLPAGTATLVILGPDGPRFHPVFAAAPEAGDGRPDPVDRWSRRVVGEMAASLGADCLFPFDGPPWPPVIRWLRETGQCWLSPVGMLVHARMGLWVSVRGLLALRARLDLPVPPAASPCESCAGQPCLTACPVGAFATGSYDVPACTAHLKGAGRGTCLAAGCAVRHACPVGQDEAPPPEQAALHMRAFLVSNG
ncbi:MAG: ferredoxin [Alphaproteobacteria bacterium]|nr:MAG: ferredoxin [Alphaproteobacteria bacterium]